MSHTGTTREWLQLNRRSFLFEAAALSGAAALSSALLLPVQRAWSEEGKYHLSDAARRATTKSSLIYVSPLRSDGSESKCHAEIWFISDGEDLFVVTPLDAWRSRAIKQGLDTARIWVGSFGNWRRSGGKYKSAPHFLAKASIVPRGDAVIEKCLADMGEKYATTGWKTYGVPFHEGTKDGSRVVIRYRPVSA